MIDAIQGNSFEPLTEQNIWDNVSNSTPTFLIEQAQKLFLTPAQRALLAVEIQKHFPKATDVVEKLDLDDTLVAAATAVVDLGDETLLAAVRDAQIPVTFAKLLTKVGIESIRHRALNEIILQHPDLKRAKIIIRKEGPSYSKPKTPAKNKGSAVIQLTALIAELRKIYSAVLDRDLLDAQISALETTIAEMKSHRDR